MPSLTPAPTTAGKSSGRRIFLVLGAVALLYAFLAGLRTVSDFDLGWQLATGRWVIQHHRVPSVDVFSYTAAGQPWIYPVGSGVLFYLAYLLGGYALLSWIGATACVGTIALSLRGNSAIGAGIAVLAVPLVALRITPRADMFSVVLFAAFLSLLWENHRTGRARLCWLPLLMAAWVNLHLGFIAGIGLALAYVSIELTDAALNSKERAAAIERLRHSAGWLALAGVATLANPWGWGIYRGIVLQQRAAPVLASVIEEWVSVPLKWAAIASSFPVRQTGNTIYVLLAIAVAAAAAALWRARWGAAFMLLAAIYVGVQFARMGPMFACVVVIVGGAVLSDAMRPLENGVQPKAVLAISWATVMLVAALAGIRCYDLVTNRFYLESVTESTFGAGLSWWFPQRASEFIQNHDLPGEVFNTFNEGGYVAWKLGPQRRDTIDGRIIPFGAAGIADNSKLMKSSPDSSVWQEQVGRYNINTILLPIGRFQGIDFVQLPDFCNSALWQPVYVDEISIVLVRRTPQTEELRSRFAVNCATAPLPARSTGDNRTGEFNAWANAAGVLSALGRNQEALTAADHALGIFPDSASLHWTRANVLLALQRWDDSEQEYLNSIQLAPSDVAWSALAESYRKRGRMLEAVDAMQHAVELSPRPHSLLLNLAYLYLSLRQPGDALRTLDQAGREAPRNIRAADNGTFDFMLAQGRSVAWSELADTNRAISFQEEAVRIESDAPEPWRRLADLYRRAGRMEEAARADQRAAAEEKRRP